jgi:hypothetical protein
LGSVWHHRFRSFFEETWIRPNHPGSNKRRGEEQGEQQAKAIGPPITPTAVARRFLGTGPVPTASGIMPAIKVSVGHENGPQPIAICLQNWP